MVSGDMLLAHSNAQLMRDALGERTTVDEDQCGAVLQNQLGQTVVDRAPVFVRGQRLQRRVGGLDPELELAPMPQVEDPAGQRLRRLVQPGQERGDLGHRLLRRREPNPRWPLFGDVIQPSQRQREVRAALVAHHGVNLVDDHRANRAQDLARALRRQHQVERLGRGDQDLRRPLDDRLALGLGRVAGAQSHPDPGQRHAALVGQLPNLGQRLLEVAADVVGQRLERRDVEDSHLVRQLTTCFDALTLADQLVDPRQERRQRLARPGRSGNQAVLAAANRRPAILLGIRRLAKAIDKPVPHERVEIVEDGGVRGVRVGLTHMFRMLLDDIGAHVDNPIECLCGYYTAAT